MRLFMNGLFYSVPFCRNLPELLSTVPAFCSMVFNKLNLWLFTFGSASTVISYCCDTTPFPNSQFGTATSALAGRVVELQARFGF